MNRQGRSKVLPYLITLASIFSLLMVSAPVNQIAIAGAPVGVSGAAQPRFQAEGPTVTGTSIYIPLVKREIPPWNSPFGVETDQPLASGSDLLTKAEALKTNYVRMNGRISWRDLQPNETDPIQWQQLAGFEDELRSVKAAGMTPIVIVDDYPRWATMNVRTDGQPTSCGPIRSDKFSAFASFVRSLVARYKTPEFNVKIWELGNEPDLDPNAYPPDNVFGCWGQPGDTYFGGKYYGEMLKVVGAAVKAEDPKAQVWPGGLLLAAPDTYPPTGGSGSFLAGILEAGAAPYLDAIPFHSYLPYLNVTVDHDNAVPGPWLSLGGNVVGKANYLREVMSRYGVNLPVFLNESGLMCAPTLGGQNTTWCDPPSSGFYRMQADHLVRTFVRGVGANVEGFIWYTLNGPGWRYVGLLDANDTPYPGYTAYQQLNLRLRYTQYSGVVNYDSGVEAYAFQGKDRFTDVVWARDNTTITISVPQSKFIAAYDRDGNAITPTLSGSNEQLQVGFDPIYVVRWP